MSATLRKILPKPSFPSDLSVLLLDAECPEDFIVEEYDNVDAESSNVTKDSENSEERAQCSACRRIFSTVCGLKLHVRRKHSSDMELLDSLNIKTTMLHKCDVCSREFMDIKSMKQHRRRVHPNEPEFCKKNHVCPLCNAAFGRNEIVPHFWMKHRIQLESEDFLFDSFMEFLAWKEHVEINSKTKFIRHSKKRKSDKKTLHYFMCHRSGNFVSGSRGIRNLKSQGSNKINGFCPARMKVQELENGSCKVCFEKTHIGHANDLEHLFLNGKEREYLASKIMAKVPFDAILAEIKTSDPVEGMDRLHLVTRKDLRNIRRKLVHNKYPYGDVYDDIAFDYRIQPTFNELDMQESSTFKNITEKQKQALISEVTELIQGVTTPAELEVCYDFLRTAKKGLDMLRSYAADNGSADNALENSSGKKRVEPLLSVISRIEKNF